MSSERLCKCGGPAAPDDTLCDRCRYLRGVFSEKEPMFDSKRERAIRAIKDRKMMRGISRILEIE